MTTTIDPITGVITGDENDNIFSGTEANNTASFADIDVPVTVVIDADGNGTATRDTGFNVSFDDVAVDSLNTAAIADDAAFVTEALAGNLYFNIHTTEFPGGEIRGQLDTVVSDETVDGVRTIVLSAVLDAAQEPNNASDSEATGSATVTIVVDAEGNATYSVDLDVNGIAPSELLPVAGVSSIHLHNAPAGVNGPVILDVVQDAGGDVTGATVDGDVFNEFTDTDTLVSIDNIIGSNDGDLITANGAAGNEINGLDGDDTILGGGGTDTLDGGAGNDTNSFANIGVGVTASLADGTATYSPNANVTINETFTNFENLEGTRVADSLTGDDNDNILTGGAGNDTLDGGLGSDTADFSDIDVPVTVVIDADGNGTATRDTGFNVSFDDVAVDSLNTAAIADDAAFVTEALAGNLYFNIHTTEFPGGEIRGQLDTVVSDETVDGVRTIVLSAVLDAAQEPNDASDSEATGSATVTIVVDAEGNATYSVDLDVNGIAPSELLPVAGVSSIHLHNAPAGVNGPVILDVVQDAGGDVTGATEDGDVFNEFTDTDTLISIENIIGSNDGDSITANGAAGNVINGLDGDDTILGGGGTDTLDGGAGFDINSFANIGVAVTASLADGTATYSPNANVTINETFTNFEALEGTAQADNLSGDENANLLIGGDGADTLSGAAGNDTLVSDAQDVLDGGEGIDTADFSDVAEENVTGGAFTGVIVDLDVNSAGPNGTPSQEGAILNAPPAAGGQQIGNLTITDVENVIGTDFNDGLFGNNEVNVLEAGAGNDIIHGFAGDDFLSGGAGIDTVLFSAAPNAVVVDLSAQVSASEFASIVAGSADAVVAATGGAGNNVLSGFENVVGSQSDDDITGDENANLLNGNGGADTLSGGAGNDTLVSDAQDVIDGGEGIDTVDFSNVAEENVTGGAFTGVIVDLDVNSAGPNGTPSQEGAILDAPPAANGQQIGDLSITDVENVIGTDFNDGLFGNNEVNVLDAGDGNDVIHGFAGDDFLSGGEGVDTVLFSAAPSGVVVDLSAQVSASEFASIVAGETDAVIAATGGAGNNVLSGFENITGSQSDDVFTGDASNNVLNGNGGSDTVNFSDLDVPVTVVIDADGNGTATRDTGFNVSFDDVAVDSLNTAAIADDAAFVTEALAGNLYFNIHTTEFPGGEIRGQLDTIVSDETVDGVRTIVLSAVLDAAQEPNDASDSEATGSATVTIVVDAEGNATYSVDLDVNGIAPSELLPVAGVSSIHLHNAPAGVNGPVILDVVQDAGGDVTGATEDGDVFNEFTDTDTLTSIENINGSNDGDSITANGAAGNVINGLGGDDTILGGGGTDTLDGGDGFDTNSFANIGVGVTASLATGTATYSPNANVTINETFTNFEALEGTNANDRLVGDNEDNALTGNDGNDTLGARAGDDTVDAGAGNDLVFAGSGDDSVSAGSGNDLVFAGSGNDTVSADSGNDTVFVGSGNDVVTGGSGNDNIFAGSGNDNVDAGSDDDTIFASLGNDTLDGGDGDDQIFASLGDDVVSGGAGDDRIFGGVGNDVVNGDAGIDVIFAGNGNDTVDGGADNDIIRGGNGDDTINGGTGNDQLFGNGGADVFVFDLNAGNDTVRDFREGIDVIDLDAFDIANFAALEAISEQVGNNVIITLDANTSITLNNTQLDDLSATDFILG
ncbi:CHRD domain-containing protein [Kordiimonas sp. SCSIO 12610]|uniref:beta strand repeat-containing protein n=1 Tax=Kordiimonas sp. SCSIO 12610 TaxID=2829597 RepID=UPI00210E3AB8|nr:CHRD domain-containing protein [Kordiimonas sp. SCSIO 12610]UTW56305.1 CHRD domain-containing protein [Kordiimonas sp. SCSIO 12610]